VDMLITQNFFLSLLPPLIKRTELKMALKELCKEILCSEALTTKSV